MCFFSFPSSSYLCTQTTTIYSPSLHDALPIFGCFRHVFNINLSFAQRPDNQRPVALALGAGQLDRFVDVFGKRLYAQGVRSEEHTSELQSREKLVCRLLLAKKNHRW